MPNNQNPEISVVMSVHNGANKLLRSMDSILKQEGVDFEFIIVDDGSADDSLTILEKYSGRDKRIRVISQEHQGLTRALIRGCSMARGNYIARQDVGDFSLPHRLCRQSELLNENQDAVLVSCGIRFVGPEEEFIFEQFRNSEDPTQDLLTLDVFKVRAPFHGSTMFRRSEYISVGGYRSEFFFAQDFDLWTRLVERGGHIVCQEVLYQAEISVSSISSRHRRQQIRLKEMVLECSRLRRDGRDEKPCLEKVSKIRSNPERRYRWISKASTLYFIGSSLVRRGDPSAKKYLWQTVKMFPLHLKAWWMLLRGVYKEIAS
jgi:glycosyltransferase involved in cell wall biosynthesis